MARHARIRAEELGAVCDLQAWLALHSVDPTDPLAKGIAGGAGRRAGSEGSPLVDEFAVREYAALRHQSEPTARALMTDIADLEHRFPKLWAAVQALWLPVGQARTIVAACRELSQEAAAFVDTEMAAVVAGLPWSRILTRLGAAIMTADPVLAEAKRQQAKSARFVQLCRSEDGINTMIVRADAGDLILVYALVDRLADILALEGNTEPADQRRATAFGLLTQPAMILAMLLRHTHDGTAAVSPPRAESESRVDGSTSAPVEPLTDVDDADVTEEADTSEGLDGPSESPSRSGSPAPTPPPDSDAEPPVWTAHDYDEPDDPTPVDHPNVPRPLAAAAESQTGTGTTRPIRNQEPDNPDPPDPDNPDPPGRSGLRLYLPGLANLLTEQGLRAARPRVMLNVYLTDQTLATGAGVVRTDHTGLGPILAAQPREFLTTHSRHITLRPVLDLDRVPSVDASEIPHQVRDAVRLRQVASVFPYSGATTAGMDLDHTNPYRCDGTPGQTGPTNLGPLTRGEHNTKPADCGPSPPPIPG